MSRASRALRLAAAAALAASLAIPAVASAASPPLRVEHITLELQTTPAVCGKEWEAFARVTDAAGVRLAGETVSWATAPVVSSQDGITDYQSVTDANGLATTKVVIDCIPGSRTLMAMAGANQAQAQAVIPISDAGMRPLDPSEVAPPPPPVKAARLILSVPPGPLPCDEATDVSLLVLAADGGTIAGAKVIWTLDPFASIADTWGANVTYTGSQGVTGNMVWPACGAGAPGSGGASSRRVLNAWVDGVSVAYPLEVNPIAAVASPQPSAEASMAPAVTPPPTATAGEDATRQAGSAAFLGLVMVVMGGAGIMALRAYRHRTQGR